MSNFSRTWLQLRAPYDTAARSCALAKKFAAALPSRPRIVDLGAGDGANARYLARSLPRATEWLLVDRDAALLPAVTSALCVDLARELEMLPRVDGVTCAAFLDLVSAAWLERFVRWLDGRPLLAALSVDGRIELTPGDDDDTAVLTAFARDQNRDKGFGPALGPLAPERLLDLLRNADYHVEAAPSDWRLGAQDGAMLEAFVAGVAAAVPAAAAWSKRRQREARAGRLRLTVGHLDVLGTR
jgi:hypothetical protein